MGKLRIGYRVKMINLENMRVLRNTAPVYTNSCWRFRLFAEVLVGDFLFFESDINQNFINLN